MKISVDEINSRALQNEKEFIESADSAYYQSILAVADCIYKERESKPIILLSGPSGSGKTTTAMLIEKILDERGCETHTLSLDNYFHPLSEEELLLHQKGELDLETPLRMDIPFLNEQLEKMIACESVALPKYNFIKNQREFNGNFLHRKPGELVILEGIHALNPDVITIDDSKTVKIYISPRTRIAAGDAALHPSYIRLCRRIIRDSQFRNRSPLETFMMFSKVEEGSKKYIMPFKHLAQHEVNTFIPYEMCVYKNLLSGRLLEIGEKTPPELLKVLEQLAPISGENIPQNSLIREFIGGGIFKY